MRCNRHTKECAIAPLIVALLVASPLTCRTSAAAVNQPTPADWDERIKFGVRAYDNGENRSAFEIFSKLMTEGSSRFGASDGRMARIYTNMGEVYDEQKQYGYAEQCLKRGLHVAQKGYGEKSLQTVPALIDLAQTYVHEGKFAQAQPLFKEALAIADKPGDSHLSSYVTVIEADLGSMYFAEANFSLGEPHFKRALSLSTQCFGASHQWTTTIGAMYAACLNAQGRSKEAKSIERAALAKANENDSPVAVWSRQIGLADEAVDNKRFADAEAALKLALQASDELSAEPMLKCVTLTRYGRLLLLQNKAPLAIDKFKAAQVIADSIFAPDDTVVLEHAKQLADLEKSQLQYPDAEPLYRRLAAHAKKQFGEQSDEYASALSDLAGLYQSWAQYPKAVTSYSELLAWQEKHFGSDSEKLIPSLVSLAIATENNTRYLAEVNEKAEGYFKRAQEIATKHFGKNSKEATEVLDALSHYYQRRLNWDKAAQACKQVIAADEKNFGPEKPETIKALEHYAVVLRAAGLRDQAEPIEARLAKIKGNAGTSEP